MPGFNLLRAVLIAFSLTLFGCKPPPEARVTGSYLFQTDRFAQHLALRADHSWQHQVTDLGTGQHSTLQGLWEANDPEHVTRVFLTGFTLVEDGASWALHQAGTGRSDIAAPALLAPMFGARGLLFDPDRGIEFRAQ